MSLNELKYMFEKRSQSWIERLQELKSQGRDNNLDATGGYPRLLTALSSTDDEFVLKAQKLTGAPVALSEERYSDYMGSNRSLSVLYRVAEYPDPEYELSEFWAVFRHLAGDRHHRCGKYCAKHELSEFVMGEK